MAASVVEGVPPERAVDAVAGFLVGRRRPFVLTGAGCSTGSGIPDYRDNDGAWKRSPPMQWQLFRSSGPARRRYWARSFVGWPRVAAARPNTAHAALAALAGRVPGLRLVTQNVDGLHQRAGSSRVIDLHGRLDRVLCLDCGVVEPRAAYQERLGSLNPAWRTDDGPMAPDGDADLGETGYEDFRVAACARCGGIVKPDVVFFGENVPRERVAESFAALEAADAVLVVGSSLMVWSGYRFVRRARALGIPVAVLNQGRTRADDEVDLKVSACCTEVLPALIGG
ncbi:NAD-dependent protein deacetylase [Ectothiorhodospiraceae bacterium WFHF3C12]|nr:NAD-dependent protein deacetylase [Ectothiorhodospiraceae bacterium WFHF3C12]